MQYQVITHFKQSTFQSEVNYQLSQGWKLQGGVSFAVNPQTGNEYFAQAMIKEGE